jgi:hypothetical protein
VALPLLVRHAAVIRINMSLIDFPFSVRFTNTAQSYSAASVRGAELLDLA